MRTFILVIFTLTLLGCRTNKISINAKFQGMWKLDKYEIFDSISNTWQTDTSRIGYSGYIIYDGKGHMGVQLTPKDYKNINTNADIDNLDLESLKDLTKQYSSNYVYFANYTFTDSSVIHTILSASHPQQIGESLIRNFEFKGDTLILTPHVGIGDIKRRLRWIKL